MLVLISQWHLCDPSLSEACRFLAGTLVLPLLSPDFQAICLSKTCSVGVPLTFPMTLLNRNQNSTVLSFSLIWPTSGSQKYSPILYLDKFWEWRQIAKQLLLCCQSSWLLSLGPLDFLGRCRPVHCVCHSSNNFSVWFSGGSFLF